jgi:hypothetical protein
MGGEASRVRGRISRWVPGGESEGEVGRCRRLCAGGAGGCGAAARPVQGHAWRLGLWRRQRAPEE